MLKKDLSKFENTCVPQNYYNNQLTKIFDSFICSGKYSHAMAIFSPLVIKSNIPYAASCLSS